MDEHEMTQVREKFASYAHEAWSGWMEYMLPILEPVLDINPRFRESANAAYSMDRWRRQMRTPYAELPEHEKESDRAEADRMIAIIRERQEAGG